jgi:hypothetical protein
MTVYQALLQMAKISPQPLLEADQAEEVLKQDKARVRPQVLRFESNLQSGPGFTSNSRFAMFHVSGLRLDWSGVLVNVHCTHAEATFYIGGVFISSLTPCVFRNLEAIFPCGLTSPGVNLSHAPICAENTAFYRAKTLQDR